MLTTAPQIGEAFALIAAGIKPGEMPMLKAAHAMVKKDSAFGRRVANLAVDVFKAANCSHYASAAIFEVLTKEASWTSTHTEFLTPFLEAMSATEKAYKKQAEDGAITKEAAGGGLMEWFSSLPGQIRDGYGDYVKTVLGLGLVGGLTAGSAQWAMGKDIEPTKETKPPLDAQIAVADARREYYKRIADETEARMRRERGSRNPSRPGDSVRDAAQYV